MLYPVELQTHRQKAAEKTGRPKPPGKLGRTQRRFGPLRAQRPHTQSPRDRPSHKAPEPPTVAEHRGTSFRRLRQQGADKLAHSDAAPGGNSLCRCLFRVCDPQLDDCIFAHGHMVTRRAWMGQQKLAATKPARGAYLCCARGHMCYGVSIAKVASKRKDKMTAIKTATDFARLMDAAAHGATSGRDATACEARAQGARLVCAYLGGHSMFGSPVSREDAVKGAARAWGSDIPADVAAAIA